MTKPPLDYEEAVSLDDLDSLSELRKQFEIPLDTNTGEQAYFAGNSLGLLPKQTRIAMHDALNKWGANGVLGHFNGTDAWYRYDESVSKLQTGIVLSLIHI